MSKVLDRERRAWIYKCSAGDPEHEYSWVDLDKGGWLLWNRRERQRGGKNWGGEDWIRSPQSWANLAELRKNDLIFCHQSENNSRGIVGLTVAASRGYADPSGVRPDRYTTLDIGPEAIAFENPVSLAEIRGHLGHDELSAYALGRSQPTFHEVEGHLLKPLLQLCIQKNASQSDEIAGIAGMELLSNFDSTSAEVQEIIRDPIRREMLIEAFERKASWARLARKLYGYKCMIPECRFKLVKEDGELYIEVHHITAMFEGGSPNDKLNLSVLCPNHHREVHYAKLARRKELTALIKREQASRLAV